MTDRDLEGSELANAEARLWGPQRLARESDGRWTLNDRPIHAGDVLELRTYSHGTGEAAWERVRFEWGHRTAGVFPVLYLGGDDPVVFLEERHFAQLPLRWPSPE